MDAVSPTDPTRRFVNLNQMASSLRPGEITYYEELGVENTASSDEIRDAFRSLARLLHPDQQTDPQLRETAERQMRKLNRVHSVLSDSGRRTAYDKSLQGSRAAPIIVFSGSDGNLKRLLVRASALAAVIFGSFLLIWFMVTSNNPEVRGQDARGPSIGKTGYNGFNGDNSDVESGDQISRLRDQLRAAETERDSALEQLSRVGWKQTDPNPPPHSGGRRIAPSTGTPSETASAAATAPTDLPSATGSAPTLSESDTSANEPTFTASRFAGLWVYANANGTASPGGKSQYPPEFIQVTMTERNGALHGQYHSRYQVLDHAISPDVDFIFNGTPSGTALDCAWQGPGGARGHLTLKLLFASTVEIAWSTTELGSQQWLKNGTATLIRK